VSEGWAMGCMNKNGGSALGGEKERDMGWVGWDWVYVYKRVKNGIWLSAFHNVFGFAAHSRCIIFLVLSSYWASLLPT
jgi:hypothetical protein